LDALFLLQPGGLIEGLFLLQQLFYTQLPLFHVLNCQLVLIISNSSDCFCYLVLLGLRQTQGLG
jgi:hypothetical protein